ncbi:MAG: DeoR/GlpR family DNA-binding transcription regulator [Tissierellia bacterium]|nr:DeoR/GlpR family DNA-binding transcription regulator [Tissierellia bacterium]
MLKDERFNKIIDLVNRRGSVKTIEIAEELNVSLATIRRDLNELDENKKIKKIFGGAKSIKAPHFITIEESILEKNKMHMPEKNELGKFAARLINDDDFIYMDAGSSVEAIVPYIEAKNLTFVTNSLGIARELSSLKYKVFILPGELKLTTDSITGSAASEYIKRFNFKLGFFGTNGIDYDFGFTTPDINEAIVKTEALSRCEDAYVVADQSKFGKLSQITFSDDRSLKIITNDKEGKDIRVFITNLKEGK